MIETKHIQKRVEDAFQTQVKRYKGTLYANNSTVSSKDTIILYESGMINWVDRPDIQTTFDCHFYNNRNCKLEYIGD